MLNRRVIATLFAAALLPATMCGCRRGSARQIPREPTDVMILAKRVTKRADLAASLNMRVWAQSLSQAPLAVAAQLASSAEGDWIAIVPKLMDDLKWQPKFYDRYSGVHRHGYSGNEPAREDTVSACLSAIRKAGDKVAWEDRNGRILLYFGTEDDLGRARAHPPDTVAAVYLRAHSCAGMLANIASFWKVRIDVDPALIARRDSLVGTRTVKDEPDQPRGMMGALSNMYRMNMSGNRTGKQPSEALTLVVEEKTGLESLLHKVAALIGGECVRGKEGWKIVSMTDRKKVSAEIERLTRIVGEKAGSDYIATVPNPITNESTFVIGTLPDEAVQAIESLVALGPAAMPALTRYLVPEKASVALTVLRNLIALGTPEGFKAVIAFGNRLLDGTQGAVKVRDVRPHLLSEIVRAVAKKSDDETARWLARAASDPKVAADLRFRARMTLAGNGKLALLQTAAARRTRTSITDFSIATSPEGKEVPQSAGGVTLLDSTKAADGTTWGVFMSGRAGDPMDFWVARGRGDTWSEFLFTGEKFSGDGSPYYAGVFGVRPPSKGALSIKANGNKIALGPPRGEKEDPLIAQLTKRLSNRTLSPAQRAQISRQLAVRQSAQWQRRMYQLQHTIVFDLKALRLDSDRDGLTDLVEKRLAMDHTKADGDGDGLADGIDGNPVVQRTSRPTDRQRILRAVFATLFGGDPSPDPIVIILERKDWTEFTGTTAPVFCLTREEYLDRLSTLASFRVLQFGGPGPKGSTIMNVDGPVVYNDTRTRAEVHFWQWNARATGVNPWMFMYGAQGSAGTPVDYVALFRRRGDAWKLDAVKQWKAETADTAMGDIMQKQMQQGVYY